MSAEHAYTEDELQLLKAARLESPPEGSAAGVLSALGLTPVVPVPSSAFPSQGPEGEPAPVSSARPRGSVEAPPKSGIFAKPATWAAAGGVALLSLLPWALNDEAPQERPLSVSRVIESPSVVEPPTGEEKVFTLRDVVSGAAEEGMKDEASTARKTTGDIPKAAPQRTSREDSSAAAPTSTKAIPSLADELAQIQKARSLLSSGDLAGCSSALAEHAQKFQPPRLSTEARVIRVELLLKQGRPAEAKALAEPLLRDDSPYRARISRLLSAP